MNTKHLFLLFARAKLGLAIALASLATTAAGQPYFPDGTRVLLQADTNEYMFRCADCLKKKVPNDSVSLSGNKAQSSAVFTVKNVGTKTYFIADNGAYVGYCNGCVVDGKVPDFIFLGTPGSTEVNPFGAFQLNRLPNGRFTLLAPNGKYVTRCAGCAPGSPKGEQTVTAHVATGQGASWAEWAISRADVSNDPAGIPQFARDPKDVATQVESGPTGPRAVALLPGSGVANMGECYTRCAGNQACQSLLWQGGNVNQCALYDFGSKDWPMRPGKGPVYVEMGRPKYEDEIQKRSSLFEIFKGRTAFASPSNQDTSLAKPFASSRATGEPTTCMNQCIDSYTSCVVVEHDLANNMCYFGDWAGVAQKSKPGRTPAVNYVFENKQAAATLLRMLQDDERYDSFKEGHPRWRHRHYGHQVIELSRMFSFTKGADVIASTATTPNLAATHIIAKEESVYSCAARCLAEERCLSFTYDKVQGFCSLNNTDSRKTPVLSGKPDFDYFEFKPLRGAN